MDGKVENSARRTTIYDIATLAETSPSAVSSVLNGSWKKRRISQKLADRILQIAEQEGYSVNLQASVLRRDRSKIIGMIIPKYDNRYFGAIAEKFEQSARSRGLFPVITCTQRDPALEFEAAKELLSYQAECIISTGATDPDRISTLCAAAGVKNINVDLPGSKTVSVISDNVAGARDLTRLILDRYEAEFEISEPLTFVGGRASDHNTGARIRGFLEAHAERGIEVSEDRVLACGYAAEKAEGALNKLEPKQIGGLFVNSTITLEGVVTWAKNIPPERRQKIRYGCFDWDPFAALLSANIGMVQQDVARMLETAFDVMEDASSGSKTILIPCILREL